MDTTIWKYESKNSHHMVCAGATNRSVEKGLLSLFKKGKYTLHSATQLSLCASSQPNPPNAISKFKTREDHCLRL